MFVLENVFLNDRGMVLDRKHIYTFDHFCKSAPLDFFRYKANQTYVYAYKEAASIAYWNGGNFYHSLLETMPALLLLKPFLELRPGLPVAIRSSQVRAEGTRLRVRTPSQRTMVQVLGFWGFGVQIWRF